MSPYRRNLDFAFLRPLNWPRKSLEQRQNKDGGGATRATESLGGLPSRIACLLPGSYMSNCNMRQLQHDGKGIFNWNLSLIFFVDTVWILVCLRTKGCV